MFDIFFDRIERVKNVDGIIIATTKNSNDETIVQYCQNHQLPYYRGSEEDVLSRFYETAEIFQVKNIVRVTPDCPIIDPKVIEPFVDNCALGVVPFELGLSEHVQTNRQERAP